MKKTYILLHILAGTLMACNNDSTSGKTTDSATVESTVPTLVESKNCFTGNVGKDTMLMSLSRDGDNVSGNLEYKFYEKDRSNGTFSGVMKGDTLIADYTFTAEGVPSTRQVAFLKDGDKLTEGYGGSEEKGGKSIFKNTQALRFGEGFVLSRSDCQ